MNVKLDGSNAQDDPTSELRSAVLAWQRGELFRDSLVQLLSRVPEDQGQVIRELIVALCQHVQRLQSTPAAKSAPEVEAWRHELMSSRARAWGVPHQAGMLVSPHLILLVSADQGLVLRDGALSCLPVSVCGSLLLLAQTIVMAQTAVDEQELRELRQQRIESTSTSLSEITPVE